MSYRLDLRHRLALDINNALQRDTLRRHPLEQLFWECTLRCNLACRHCGSDCKVQAEHPDMPLEDFLPVLDSVNAARDFKAFLLHFEAVVGFSARRSGSVGDTRRRL